MKKALLRSIEHHKSKVFILILGIVLSSIVEYYSIESIQTLVEAINTSDQKIQFIDLLPFLLNLSLKLILLYYTTLLSFQIAGDYSTRVLDSIILKGIQFEYLKQKSTLISASTNKSFMVAFYYFIPIMNIVSGIITATVILGTIVIKAPALTFLFLGSLLAFYLVIILLSKSSIRDYSKEINQTNNNKIEILESVILNLRELTTVGLVDKYREKFIKNENTLVKAQSRSQFISFFPRTVLEYGALIIIGLLFIFIDAIEITELGIVLYASQRLLPISQQVYHSFIGIKTAESSLEEIIAITDEKSNTVFRNNISVEKITINLDEANQIKSISSLHEGLVEIDLIKKNNYRICGKTGSGKTTLMDALSGLRPMKGVNHERGTSNLKFLYLSQTFSLPNESIRNILTEYSNELLSDEYLIEQLRLFSCFELIDRLDEKIGEGGINISGGEKQRLYILRGLNFKPNVIFLDEVTSGINDSISRDIYNYLHQFPATLFIIEHNLALDFDVNEIKL